jgi:hypothetical protein
LPVDLCKGTKVFQKAGLLAMPQLAENRRFEIAACAVPQSVPYETKDWET